MTSPVTHFEEAVGTESPEGAQPSSHLNRRSSAPKSCCYHYLGYWGLLKARLNGSCQLSRVTDTGEDESAGRKGAAVHSPIHSISEHSMLTEVSLRSRVLGWTLGTRWRWRATIGVVYMLMEFIAYGGNRHCPHGFGLRSARRGNHEVLPRLLDSDREQPPQLRSEGWIGAD